MQKLKGFLGRLFKIRNVAPIVVIVIAVAGSLELFGTSVKSEQVVMALLGFLAIDALVERLELLTSLEQGVKTIQDKLAPQAISDAFFAGKDPRKLESVVDAAQNEICIYGITLDTIVTLVPVLQRKLSQGCRVRILSPDPDGESLAEIAEYFAGRQAVISSRLRNNLDVLSYRLTQIREDMVELRVLNGVLLTGYVISDAVDTNGRMLIQLYAYKRVRQAPLFELSREKDQNWFSVYLAQFEQAWKDAVRYNTTLVS